MKILIHSSLDFANEMVIAQKYLEKYAYTNIILPELTCYQHIRDELNDDLSFTKIKNKLTIENINNVEICDCLLILNYTHRGIKNYIGGNSFLEMVIAFYLNKPIYLLNDIPENMSYTEEVKAMYPIIVNDLENFASIIMNNMIET